MGAVVDPRELRIAFGTFMTGVTVVTAVSAEGIPVGFTANSYTSVSLDPPLLLVCPARSLSCFEIFNSCRHFAVNILAENQQDTSNIFASSKADRFAQVSWHADASGCPIIHGSAAFFSCTAEQRMETGDHLVLVGRIDTFQTTDLNGLGYSNGGYFSLGLERRAAELPKPSRPVTVGAIVEHDGQVLMRQSPQGMRLPQVESTSLTGSLAAIRGYLIEAGLDVSFGPVYSIIENTSAGEYSIYYRGTAKDAAPRGLGTYFPVEDISSMSFASKSLTDMMQRYLLERQNGVFGIYVGDDREGDVHMFGEA